MHMTQPPESDLETVLRQAQVPAMQKQGVHNRVSLLLDDSRWRNGHQLAVRSTSHRWKDGI